jgi:hypothetical protein
MNDSSTGPVVMVFLFILRCLIPLAIMFGISYILQRLGLVGYPTGEDEQNQAPDDAKSINPPVAPKRSSSQTNGKRKIDTPQKRSRSK